MGTKLNKETQEWNCPCGEKVPISKLSHGNFQQWPACIRDTTQECPYKKDYMYLCRYSGIKDYT